MIFLEDILSQETVQRLGWTLLHFIWQAAAVALILAILLRILRKSSANLRYILACLALALIVLLPVITIQMVPVSHTLTAANLEPAPPPTMLPTVEMSAPETIVVAEPSRPESVIVLTSIPIKQRAVDILEPALPYIVSGWLIGVFGLSIWNLGGWAQLHRLKRRMVKQVDSTLLDKLKILNQKLKVKQTVRLMESAIVQIPTVVGWLRPVILLPASALTGLNTEQLEAIIAHELAHIKRFDYLINILQTVVETLGFYHPAVWWISHKIRTERENCCDDIAVSIYGDRISYAGALASMEEIRAAHAKLAVAATGGNLFRRICRLLGKDSAENTGLSWVPAATAILLIIALAIPTTLALTNKSQSLPSKPQIELQVEDDIITTTAKAEDSPVENIPPLPLLTTSPAPPDEDKAPVVKANFFVVEVLQDSKIDTEILKEAEELLGNKISLRNTKVDVILRQVAKSTVAAKDESDRDKRITGQQFNALVKMLDSKGYLKILTNPMIETLSGKTATIISSQKVPLQQVIKAIPDGGKIIRTLNENEYVKVVDLIEITPHVSADGQITLDVKADIGSLDIPESMEQTIPAPIKKLSTRILVNSGESAIIGGLVNNAPATGHITGNSLQQANELLFIITPTIMTPPAGSKEITDTQIEGFKRELSAQNLKRLGLAVAMYADDNNDNLPESIQKLKPYIRDQQNFNWILDNVEYFDKGKTAQRNAHFIPIAYDKTLFEKADGTNILFLDFSVRFVDKKEFEKLDLNIKRDVILIDSKFLSVSEDFLKNINLEIDSKGIAQSNLTLTPEILKSLDFSKTQNLILNDLDVNLLLSVINHDKDSKVLAAPQVICRDSKTAKIFVGNKIPILTGYTEPNSPSENPKPKFDQVEKGISLSLTPRLTPNNNIYMQFKFEIINVTGLEEKTYKGKYPYKQPTIHSTEQATQYTAKNGQTLLFGPYKIADHKDGQTEEKDLLILITTHIIGSSKLDKPVQAKQPVVVESPVTTAKVITPPTIAKGRKERPKDSEQEKTESVTEPRRTSRRRPAPPIDESPVKIDVKNQVVTTLINLKYYDISEMANIVKPLLTNTGHIIQVEGRNSLIISDTAENLKRIEKIIAHFDVPKTDQTVQKFFKLKYYSPSKMAQILTPLLNKTGYISADENTGNLLVIDTVENLKRIELIITKYDVPKAVETVTEIFEIRNGDPVEIVELLKKLINGHPENGAIIEQGKEPIVLIPEPRRKWIIAKGSAENMKQISQWIKKLDTDKTTMGLDPIDKAVHEQLEMIVDLSVLSPGMSFGEVIEILENSVAPPVQIQPIWRDLLENAEVEQATPAGMDPLTGIKLRKALEILLVGVSTAELPKLTYIVDDGAIVIGTEKTLPPKMGSHVYDTSDLLGTDATKASPENMSKIAEQIKESDATLDVHRIKPRIIELQNSDAEQMVEMLKTLLTKESEGALNIKDILIDRGIKVNQKIVGPLYEQLTFEEVPGTNKLIVISKIPEAYDVIEEFISDLDRQNVSPENLKQIIQSRNKLDTEKTIGMDPLDAAVYEQLETIVDLSDLNQGTSFGEVIEKLENSVDPPLQIQPIWKDLLENAEVEQATPAEMDPLTGIKLRKALEILLASVTTSQLGESAKPTYIVDDGVIVIGTAGMLPQKLWIEKLNPPKTTIGLDPIDAPIHEQLEMIVDLSDLNPGTSFGEVIEILKNSVVPPLQIQPIWKDLLENAEVEQATPAGMDPLPHIKLRKALEILLASVTTSQLGESARPTYIVDQGVIVIGTVAMLSSKMELRGKSVPILIETADESAQPFLRERQKTTPAIKPHELQILRQRYINNDSLVKSATERITRLENELIEMRQKLTPSHPEIRKKASLLQAFKNALQKREKEVGESFDDIMAKEIYQSNKEQIDKLLDDLQTKFILSSAQKVHHLSLTFVDETIVNALQSIAELGNVTIIPDETVKGLVSCKLKDVTVEAALDIILAGTPYIWKKTPYYYLVASGGVAALEAEPSEITERMESAKKLSSLGKALLIYANGHNDKYPDSLHHLPAYTNLEDFKLVLENIEYLAHGKTINEPPDTIIAYDKKLLAKGKGTNVLYNDCHVAFVKAQELKKLNIGRRILIETQFWSVNEDFLKDVGLDVNFEDISDDWRGHLAATYPAGPNGKLYGLMIDDLHLTFLLRSIQSHKGSKALVGPRVLTREGTTAEMSFLTEEYYYKDYKEPNNLTEELEPNIEKVEIGTRIWLTPELTDDTRKVNLDFKLELTQLEGIIESRYKEKYPIYKPIIDVTSAKMPCTIPAGKTMLIGGLKIIEHIRKEPSTLLGEIFKRGIMRNDKMLLILVKPVTNPQQKATKVLPGQKDSEEQIRRLAEQLDKKLKSPVN